MKDGTLEIAFPDGVVRKIKADGSEEIAYSDGSVVTIETNGDRVLLLPNGQKEIHTREHKVASCLSKDYLIIRRVFSGGNIRTGR